MTYRLIEGDGLTVLGTLLPVYKNRVRCVYIDPPYNTGHPLAYADSRPSGAWATMMRERLTLVRDLLDQAGSVWISIDDNELPSLRIIADSLFDRVATVVWEKRVNRENRSTFSQAHEYVLVYARDAAAFKKSRHKLSAPQLRTAYKNPDGDPRGPWQPVPLTVQAGHAATSQFYTYTTPSGRAVTPPPGRAWAVTLPRLKDLEASGALWFGAKGTAQPVRKRYLESSALELTPSTLWPASEVGDNASARSELIHLMDGDARFDTPKPVQLVQRILQIATDKDSLVLDFFAGSGTTAEAVVRLNASDGGTRGCILAQSSELFSDGSGKIFDYMVERVCRVAPKDTVEVFRAGA